MVEGGIDAGKFPHKSKNDKIKATITDMLTNCVPQSIDSLLAKLGEIDKSAGDHVAAVYPKLKALHTDPNFTKMKDLKHSVASTLKAEEGIPFLRVEGKVPVGLMDFLGLLRNPEIHNKDSKGHELVKGYIAGVGLFREAVKAPWPVEDRDFSLINLIHFDEDGAIYYLRTSYDTPDLPPVKKHTRGEINVYIYIYCCRHYGSLLLSHPRKPRLSL